MNFWNKKRKKEINNRTITSVLLGSYIKSMIISAIIGMFLFAVITGKQMDYKQSLEDSRILTTFSHFINMQLEDIKRFSYKLMIEENLQTILGTEQRNNQHLNTFLINKMAERNEIQSIHIVMGNEVISEYKQPVFSMNPKVFSEKLETDIIEQGGISEYWEIGKDAFGEEGNNTFYLVSSIKSRKDLKHLGYLVVFLDPNSLQKDINLYLEEVGYDVLIKSNSDNIISFPLDSNIMKYSDELLNFKEKAWWNIIRINQYSFQELASIKGEIYGMTRKSIFYPNIEFAILFMIITTMVFIIFASVIIKKSVTAPLEEIATRARDIGVQVNLDILFPNKSYYSEIDDISMALNDMMGQIKNLISEISRREKLEKRLELSVINHQIKPHFLYNTLNAVSILVSVEEKESANELIKSLAKYYRACLNQGRDSILLSSELDIVQEYIKIALIRNPNILRVSYDIDDDCIELLIPKMTIQTLVENSIKYGIKEMGEPILISISAKVKRDYVELCVMDNGNGMKKDIINSIMRGEEFVAESGFGLKSVVARISLFYDIKNISDIICIESKEGEYTKVFLKIPFRISDSDKEKQIT